MSTEKLVYDGFHQVFQIEDVVKGKKVKREKIMFKSAVAGIVIDENNRIGLVSQYRPVIEKQTWELPGGLQDKEGLTPLQVLMEELEEECGIKTSDILSASVTPVHEYYMVIGSSPANILLYEIRVKTQKNKQVNDIDVDEVIWVTLKELEQMIQQGLICDPKTIIAHYYVKSRV